MRMGTGGMGRGVALPGLLLDLDRVTHQPQINLLQTVAPAGLELPHPPAAFRGVREIDDETDEIISVEHATVTPMALHLLSLIARRTKAVHNLENRLRQPFAGNGSSIIELERQQHLEAPPFACHRWLVP